MTNKRFELDYDDEDCACISNFLENGEKLTDGEVVDLLNTFYQENTELKGCVRCDPNEIESMVKEIHCLKEENEQLRQELNNCEKFRYTIFKRMGELNNE